ncbi:hypothetical protein CsSME_00011321 [Camellia sinensis var. sinensis]
MELLACQATERTRKGIAPEHAARANGPVDEVEHGKAHSSGLLTCHLMGINKLGTWCTCLLGKVSHWWCGGD